MTTNTVELNRWVKPGTNEVRLYVGNILDILGLEIERYKTGNICYATLRGETLSNSKASEIADVKVFLLEDSDGKPQKHNGQVRVWVQNLGRRSPLSAPQIADRVRSALIKEEI